MNSAGSAAAENDRYMESINAHVQNLKATFQDFARNVFNEEFVKRILDTANALLEFVNTPFGQAATRISTLSAVLFGLGGILKSYWKYFVQGSAIAKGIKDVIGAMNSVSGPGLTGMEKFASLFTNLPLSLGQTGLVAAGIAALVVAVNALADANEKANRSMADFDKEIKNANDQLATNKQRLDEINAMPWNERSSEIVKERQELEAENAELEKQVELLKKQKIERAQRGTGEGFQFGFTNGSEAYSTMLSYLAKYNDELERTGEISDENRLAYDKTVAAAANQVEMLKVLQDAGYELSDQEKQLIAVYEEHGNVIDRTTGKCQRLVSGLIAEAQQSGATGQALYDLVAAQITASNTNLNFSQQIAALQTLGYQAGLAAAQMNAVFGTNMSSADQVRNRERTIQAYMKQGMSRKQAEAKYLSETQRYLSWSIANTTSKVTSGGGGSYVPKPSGQSAAESARQAQIKALQAGKDQIQDTIDAINDKYDAEVKAIEKEKDTIQDTIDEIKEAYNDQIDALEQEQDAVQETIDAINAKYDAQLDALEKYNDELEDEIELQQILEDMAKAKSTKKMVYKDGRFQYVEDLDAVAAAQTRLDEYNRKQALKKQKADIEEQRQLELKAYEDKKALLEQEQAIIEKRHELEIKSYESNKQLLEKEKENIDTRRENELASYNERKNLLEQQIKALQNGFSAELGAWDDYLAQLQAKIDEKWRLLNSGPSGGGGGGIPTSTVLPSAPSGLHSNTADPNYKMPAAEAVARRNQGLANAEKANKASAAKKGSSSKPPLTKPSSAKSPQQRLAGGTMSAHGGLTLVGENGPELRVLNQGDGILPSNITRNLWTMATNPVLRLGHSVNTKNTAISVANITLPNVRNAEEFVSGLKNMAYQRAYARA